ncbi:C25 family cysteine peptidase [Chitinophaga vietnamensis]|uniref:C25 family cysteine peptidase n=1 Tax=Chitinophaga vietnamensis TaxID=2593957 RepID=UPI00137590D3|nr:C25 family cysteine peptidase [Chitinophaga vietnamensis]
MQSTKLIITNKTALQQKYGDQHQAILNDLAALQAFDGTRHLDTHIIFLDDAAQMQSLKATAVTDPADEAQNKQAIDELYAFFSPGYILIAGAQDIVPFQRLKNMLSGDTDPDTFIPSDMPYACDAPYDKDPGKFVSPTRVVGRLPDVPAQNDPAYFHSLVQDIINIKSLPQSEYRSYFSISTFDWQDSTQHSLRNIFGDNSALRIVPGTPDIDGHNWTVQQLMPKTHFINCHGAIYNAGYYGQKSYDFPLAMQSDTITGKISSGTVVAAECCYGGQLYDPSKNISKLMSMANSYLLNHAIAFVGSTNIAYGPSTGQGLADLLTQYFVINVLNGASTGRAMLEARQKFLNEMGPTLDPYELKTAAQFNLFGDPSLQPVINEKDPATDIMSKSFVNSVQNRRDNLEARGKILDTFISAPQPADESHTTDPGVQDAMHSLLSEKQYGKSLPKVFVAKKEEATPSVKFHVFSEPVKATNNAPASRALVVKEKNNQILGYREYVSR